MGHPLGITHRRVSRDVISMTSALPASSSRIGRAANWRLPDFDVFTRWTPRCAIPGAPRGHASLQILLEDDQRDGPGPLALLDHLVDCPEHVVANADLHATATGRRRFKRDAGAVQHAA